MRFEGVRRKNVLVVKILESRIVADVAPRFKEELIAYAAQESGSFILDLSEVTFIDSSGLGALIGSLKAMGSGRELLLCGARESVVNMFKLTRMNKVFRMYDTPEEAESALE